MQFSVGFSWRFLAVAWNFFNQDAELVGSGMKMQNQLHVFLQELEYADDMALIADSMDAGVRFWGVWVSGGDGPENKHWGPCHQLVG